LESNGSKIVAGIIGLGRSLGLKVTAEGVETKEQWMLLQDHKCDALQGYLFGRPMPALKIESLFKRSVIMINT
jgi:EAL domain-containing protein (putative c-di-GMP-specific phosphodiesterase class I)